MENFIFCAVLGLIRKLGLIGLLLVLTYIPYQFIYIIFFFLSLSLLTICFNFYFTYSPFPLPLPHNLFYIIY